MTLTIGLTGGIASGKSLVTNAFLALGVPVLDADQVSRDVVAPGEPALARIAKTFGNEYILDDGTLNRRRLREKVFAEEDSRRLLEAITHPFMKQRMKDWRDAQTAPYCVLAIAILIESRMGVLADRILVIDVPVEVQMRRLIDRDGIDETLAKQMIAAQATRAARLDAADDVIENNAAPDDVRAAVGKLHEHYLQIAAKGTPKAPGLRLP